MPAKYEQYSLFVVALLHLVIVFAHGVSHVAAKVPNTPLQMVFILLFIVLAPLGSVFIAWRVSLRRGAGLFALSMLAAFMFGYAFHFVIESPDLHSNVAGDYTIVFFHTSLSLALFEFVGFVLGMHIWLRNRDHA